MKKSVKTIKVVWGHIGEKGDIYILGEPVAPPQRDSISLIALSGGDVGKFCMICHC